VLWANTSFGIFLYWWHSNKQQPGRGSIGKSTLLTLPTLNVEDLNAGQLKSASDLFDTICNSKLLPAHQLDKDPVRRQLDESFSREVLGLPQSICDLDGPLQLLRMKLAGEPSVRGQKSISKIA
jgi:hypothetical protein